jgi:hypothetical protein
VCFGLLRSHCTLIIRQLMLIISSLLNMTCHICIVPISLSKLHICCFCTTINILNTLVEIKMKLLHTAVRFSSQKTELWVLQIPPFLIYLGQKATNSYAHQVTIQHWVSHITIFLCLNFCICKMPILTNTCPAGLMWMTNEIMIVKRFCKL